MLCGPLMLLRDNKNDSQKRKQQFCDGFVDIEGVGQPVENVDHS